MNALSTKKFAEQRGFTLIELLMVIALIASITLFSIGIYQQQALNFKIDRTALQMQAWLEAAKAFYADCGAWPGTADGTYDSIAQLTGFDSDKNSVITCNGKDLQKRQGVRYIMDMSKNPWDKSYILKLPNPNDPESPSTLFQVSTEISDEVKYYEQILQRIAGRLPNSTVINNQVSAGISPPTGIGGGNGSGGNNLIISIKEVKSGDQIAKPGSPNGPAACPSGTEPKIYLSMKQFRNISGCYSNQIDCIGSQFSSAQITIDDSNANFWRPLLSVYMPYTPNLQNPYSGSDNIMTATITCEPTMSLEKKHAASLPFTF